MRPIEPGQQDKMTTYQPSPNVVAYSKYGPMIVNCHDLNIGRTILTQGTWDERNITVVADIARTLLEIRPWLRIYDIGANIGTHSLAWARLLGDRAGIRAFEAQSAIYHMLCGTLALNNLDNVSPHWNVVSDKAGESVLVHTPDYMVPNNFGGLELGEAQRSERREMVYSGTSEIVSSVTIDSFDEDVDIVKMDIEGMELVALRGATATFARSRPVVMLEISKSDFEAIKAFFLGLDYDISVNGNDAICSPSELKLRFR